MPSWMRRPVATPGRAGDVSEILDSLRLNTVCRSAKCPNRGECYASGTATFLIMGAYCTRGCRFCAVEDAAPLPLDADEPRRVAEAAARMGLRHVVVTTVTRDDLPDGGAAHFVEVIERLRSAVPRGRIEVLTSDFAGNMAAVDPEVRPAADYGGSLSVLARVRETDGDIPTKSGLMVGLGESFDEVVGVLHDLRRAGVGIVTIGQYLRPSAAHLPVTRFVEPTEFDQYAEVANALGFSAVASAPFVRSSYRAAEVADAADSEG
jgi:lipoic acid synthetase